MEAEEDDMIVVIIQENEGVPSKGYPSSLKKEVKEEYESNDVNDLIETAQRHGELLDLDILRNIKSEDESFEIFDEEDKYMDGEEYHLNKNDNDENDEDYKNDSDEGGERKRWKMIRPSERKSYIKELIKEQPTYKMDKESLVQHLATVMKASKPPSPPADFFRVHELTLMYECMNCGNLENKLPAAVRHYQEKHGPRYLICYACGVDFRSKTNLYKHEKRCNAPYIGLVLRARALTVGRKGRHRPFLVLAQKPEKKQSQKFMCDQCSAVFMSKTGLTAHQNLHRGERPYKCLDCGVAYTSKSALSRHQYSKHKNMKFICDHCGRDFSIKHALATHMDTHLPEKKFPCPYGDCDRRFAHKFHLNIHINNRHRHLPPPCACELCPRRFARMSLLKGHMKKAHGMILMTRTMFFKSMPNLSKTQVQQAKIYYESDVGRHRPVDYTLQDGAFYNDGKSQDGAVVLREDTGEFMPQGYAEHSTETAGNGGKEEMKMLKYLDNVLKEKIGQIPKDAKVVVIENGEVAEGGRKNALRKEYEKLLDDLKEEVPDIGESMPEI